MTTNHNDKVCANNRRAVQDTLDVIGGKWRLLILITLRHRPFRFTELAREIGISSRMLAKELYALELNKLVSRTVQERAPGSVEYRLTEYGLSLSPVFDSIRDWGVLHRETMIR